MSKSTQVVQTSPATPARKYNPDFLGLPTPPITPPKLDTILPHHEYLPHTPSFVVQTPLGAPATHVEDRLPIPQRVSDKVARQFRGKRWHVLWSHPDVTVVFGGMGSEIQEGVDSHGRVVAILYMVRATFPPAQGLDRH